MFAPSHCRLHFKSISDGATNFLSLAVHRRNESLTADNSHTCAMTARMWMLYLYTATDLPQESDYHLG